MLAKRYLCQCVGQSLVRTEPGTESTPAHHRSPSRFRARLVHAIATRRRVLESNVYTIAVKTSSISHPAAISEVHVDVSDVRLVSRCDLDRSR